MAEEIEQPDPGATPQGGELGTGEPEKPEQPEFFLEVNERTRYRDSEEAKRGYQNLQDRVTSYSRFGDPEEIAGRLGRLEALERMAGGEPKAEGPKSAWTKEEIAANKRWFEEAKKAGILTEMGLMTKAEFEEQLATQQEETRMELVTTANNIGAKWIQDHELNLTEAEVMEALEFGGAMVNSSQRINQLFFSGKLDQVVNEVLSRYFAAQLKPKEPAGGGNGAQPNPERAAAAAKQVAGDKKKTLLSAPPKGGAPATTVQEPPNLADPKIRKVYMRQRMEEKGLLQD